MPNTGLQNRVRKRRSIGTRFTYDLVPDQVHGQINPMTGEIVGSKYNKHRDGEALSKLVALEAGDSLEIAVLFRDWIRAERRRCGQPEINEEDDENYNEILSEGGGSDVDQFDQQIPIPTEEPREIIKQLEQIFLRISMPNSQQQQQKILIGEAGYVLEDVPNLSDYIPNLPIVVHKNSPRGIHFRRAGPRQKVVNGIHKRGGTILGTSRGGHDTKKIVDSIQDRGINQEIRRRGLNVAVAGIPKTIDNDIPVIDKSFGFDSAVEEAQRAISAAHVEATSFENGIGLVKLMGRDSGFIAMYATLASRDVDCCLIPESPFYLEGRGGLFEYIEHRLKANGHMVIVIAEGAGQELVSESLKSSDPSGNKLLHDVGLWISERLKVQLIAGLYLMYFLQ
ncbi:hypothetical protein RND71_005077 [Anisodus tanguticus]|uniref:Phosphofructokinase domain-containing protein n=1 Tax=Anisodus tanguticus TaxID=243964 RepID=A0AAE1SQS4_9SOLA|nr:hypothetical protein RND71_005077 [Anisodus tanguticus]